MSSFKAVRIDKTDTGTSAAFADSGGAGHLTSHFPKAKLIAHEKGARHLVDPSRLMAFSRR